LFLAISCREQARRAEANALYRESAAVFDRNKKLRERDKCVLLREEAFDLVRQKKYKEAVPIMDHAIALWEKDPGDDPTMMPTLLCCRGDAYRDAGQEDKARGCYERAAATFKAKDKYPNVAEVIEKGLKSFKH